jgi:uncharacterized protein (DUF433 family)
MDFIQGWPTRGEDMSAIDRITMNPDVCSGRLCIRGLRIRVKDVLDLMAAGATREEILADYPYLESRRHHRNPGVCRPLTSRFRVYSGDDDAHCSHRNQSARDAW